MTIALRPLAGQTASKTTYRRALQLHTAPALPSAARAAACRAANGGDAGTTPTLPRRALLGAAAAAAVAAGAPCAATAASEPPPFVTTQSGLRIQDVREGAGASPRLGDRVSVHWVRAGRAIGGC
jgi:hypothetical protein